MKQRAQNKLQSNTGASISFALLLFLVCTVIGAIVLTAGTAASGRLAKAAEMDRRYYAVASAAELLEKELCAQEVTIVREMTTVTTVTETHTFDENNAESVSTSAPSATVTYRTRVGSDPWITTPGVVIGTGGMDLPAAQAVYLLFGGSACNTAAAMDYTLSGGAPAPLTLALRHSDASAAEVEESALAVDGTLTPQSGGVLVFDLHNTSGDPYTLRLTLTPEIREQENTPSPAEATVKTATENGYTLTTTTTETFLKTAAISWKVGSIRKVVAS